MRTRQLLIGGALHYAAEDPGGLLVKIQVKTVERVLNC
jgi:hypothetical protein